MLLGVDWPHLEEIITQILAKKGGEWEKDPGVVCSRTLEEEEGADLDMEQMIGDGYFREEQRQEPLFQNCPNWPRMRARWWTPGRQGGARGSR